MYAYIPVNTDLIIFKFTMVAELCSRKMEEYKTLVHLHGTFMLIFCVLNLIFSLVATLGNLLVIHALWKSSSIPAILKKLFLSLAVSDLAVGLIAQLMVGVESAVMLQIEASGNPRNYEIFCPTILTIYMFVLMFLASASFLIVTVIAVDRFLAISLHLRYQEIVTSKRVILVLICLWSTSVVAASMFISIPDHNLLVVVVIEFYGFFVTTVVYIRIYKVVRYHKNQIMSQCLLHDDRAIKELRENKSAINSVLVYVVFIACFVPNACCTILLIVDRFRMSFLVANHVSVFLALLNSSLNPLIYCWRYREIRQILKTTVKKILRIN